MHAHDWHSTRAHQLFATAVMHTGNRRFATANGLAFEAKPTGDGTWHGFPIPWENVPPELKDAWLDEGRVEKRATKLFRSFEEDDIYWPLRTDP